MISNMETRLITMISIALIPRQLHIHTILMSATALIIRIVVCGKSARDMAGDATSSGAISMKTALGNTKQLNVYTNREEVTR